MRLLRSFSVLFLDHIPAGYSVAPNLRLEPGSLHETSLKRLAGTRCQVAAIPTFGIHALESSGNFIP